MLDTIYDQAKEAADIEDSVDKHPLPVRGLLGDMLVEPGKYEESRLASEDTLEISANRLRSRLGSRKAGERPGITGNS